MMSFLSTVVSSRFPTTNNQLRNSSNPRQQVTVHDGRVTVQPVQGRQTSFASGMSGTRANISGIGGNNSGQQRIVKCFNCQEEDHMARQCPKPKKKWDATWFRDKVLLIQVLQKVHFLEFLADPAKAVLMTNLSSYSSDVVSEVPHYDNTNNDMLNQSVQEMPYSEPSKFVEHSKNEIHIVQDKNSSAQQDALILSVFEQLSNQVTNCNKVNNDNIIANETLSAKLERYKERVKLLEEIQNVELEDMDSKFAHMVAASKVPMLKPENGNTPPKKTVVEGVEKVIPPISAEEKAQKRLEDAKLLLEAIEKRFGGNAATKKTQRNLLKQHQLEILGETLSQEDVNQKLLRSLSLEWNTHFVVWRNKPELETMSMDDLYKNLKVYEPEVKGTSSSNTSTQNMVFMSSNNSGSTNEAVNTAHGVSAVSTQVSAANSTNVDNLSDAMIYAFFSSQPNNLQLVNEDLQQLHPDDLEEMDFRWQMAID
ncbi:ribonuclease H-like domain-containing protein, partial [Tanacetum coccineum]